MRVHHRIPTIFNLSMVDVLCCALGCVILLWLLNLREASDRSAAVDQATGRLGALQSQLADAGVRLASLTAERDAEIDKVERLRKEREKFDRDLAVVQQLADELGKNLQSHAQRARATDDRLSVLTRQQQTLMRDKRTVEERLAQLTELLHDKDAQSAEARRRVDQLTMKLEEAQTQVQKLRTDAERLKAQLTTAEEKAQSVAAKAQGEKTDLADANRAIERLQKENKSLADQAGRIRASAENRFEGIELTGRKVLFLVDMSGSMELVDEKTPAPQKWTGVRDTVVKIMKSLPDLQRFQVLLFSDKLQYLLGSDGAWIDFNASTSPDAVYKALTALRPQGSTNMHAAMEAAFRFRALGLDTIYLMSDGLPNDGPGLTLEQSNTLKENERSEVLSRHIRNILRREWNRQIAGQPKVKINTVGFFYESPDVGAFLWALARENEGGFVGMSRP
jgi:von Willebrand factor type A domain